MLHQLRRIYWQNYYIFLVLILASLLACYSYEAISVLNFCVLIRPDWSFMLFACFIICCTVQKELAIGSTVWNSGISYYKVISNENASVDLYLWFLIVDWYMSVDVLSNVIFNRGWTVRHEQQASGLYNMREIKTWPLREVYRVKYCG